MSVGRSELMCREGNIKLNCKSGEVIKWVELCSGQWRHPKIKGFYYICSYVLKFSIAIKKKEKCN